MMKATKISILLGLIIFFSLNLHAQQESKFSLIQPRAVVAGRNFNLTFRLMDGEGNPPQAPQLPHCKLVYGPSTSTMHFEQNINGRRTSSYSIDYTFIYEAMEAGEVRVPEVSITSEGKVYKSKPATFNILPPDTPTGGNSGMQPLPYSRPNDYTNSGPKEITKDDLLVRVTFSKSHVYEQEPVIATIKVYTKYDISSFIVTTQPSFEGFLCEEIPVKLEMDMEHYNGQNYHTAVLKKLLLYPQKSGQLSVNSGKYDVTLVQYVNVSMGFFTTQRPIERNITTSSNSANLTIEPLPQPQPAGFNGAVGHFTASGVLEPELLKTNEAATYTYRIEGTGNIKFLTQPKMDFPAGIDVYTPKSDINAKVVGSNMTGTNSTVFTIVPQEQGTFSIHPPEFVFFDPDKKEYKTIEIPGLEVKVSRGASTSAAVTEQNAINAKIDDILHIHSLKPGKKSKPVYYSDNLIYWLYYIVTALLLIGIVIGYRRHIRLSADVAGRRLAKAARVANKRLKEAKSYLSRKESDKFYTSLSTAIKGYLGDKMGIPTSQLVTETILERLESKGVDDSTIKELISVLDTCEMARFTPMNSETEMQDVYNKAVTVIRNIEK